VWLHYWKKHVHLKCNVESGVLIPNMDAARCLVFTFEDHQQVVYLIIKLFVHLVHLVTGTNSGGARPSGLGGHTYK